MKLLLSLLASLMLLAPAASAETWWLILAGRAGDSGRTQRFFEKIPMQSEEQCEAAGLAIRDTDETRGDSSYNYKKNISDIFGVIKYLCVVGK